MNMMGLFLSMCLPLLLPRCIAGAGAGTVCNRHQRGSPFRFVPIDSIPFHYIPFWSIDCYHGCMRRLLNKGTRARNRTQQQRSYRCIRLWCTEPLQSSRIPSQQGCRVRSFQWLLLYLFGTRLVPPIPFFHGR